MYNLKTAPKAWHFHFADTMLELGAKRLRSETNMYYFLGKDVYVMCYIDDILAVGLQDSTAWFFGEQSRLLLVKHLGELRHS